jgi:hypothetical protein
MLLACIVAAAVVVLIIILLSSSVRCRLSVNHENSEDEIIIHVDAVFGLVKKRIAVPIITFKNFYERMETKAEYMDEPQHQLGAEPKKATDKHAIKNGFQKARELLAHCSQFNKWLTDTLAHVRCTRLFWKTEVGVGDAAETALTTGMIWGLKTSLLGVVFRFIKLAARPQLHVAPFFNETKFSTQLLILAQIRFFYIVVAGIRLLYRIVKVKNGLKTWQRVLFKA